MWLVTINVRKQSINGNSRDKTTFCWRLKQISSLPTSLSESCDTCISDWLCRVVFKSSWLSSSLILSCWLLWIWSLPLALLSMFCKLSSSFFTYSSLDLASCLAFSSFIKVATHLVHANYLMSTPDNKNHVKKLVLQTKTPFLEMYWPWFLVTLGWVNAFL